ncbi:hypothetical protein CcrBL47_gp454 [Caulobacter phage BL47]|nr:hypothetical protein CcrBL47_gp454 [Caulobacter phage BL47]
MLPNNLGILSLSELVARFTDARADLEANMKEACILLMELRRRGQSKPAWRKGVFQWAEQVANGSLHPRAALIMGESTQMIRGILGLPPEEQLRIAEGGVVTVAILRTDGVVVAEDQSIPQMSQVTFDLVFDQGVVRTFDAQKKILLDRASKRRAHRSPNPVEIRVDRQSEEVIVGQVRLSVQELATALNQLGFKVERREKPRVRVQAGTQEALATVQ